MFEKRGALAMGAAFLVLALGAGAGGDVEQHAKGTFEVKLTPVTDNSAASARMSSVKTYSGDLIGTSKGDMWTTESGVKGSAGYVAIEKFEGTLDGKHGTFTLMHHATMRRGGDFQIRIVVVPESGTGELAGLSGTMTMGEKGFHSYTLDYTIAQTSR